MNAKHEILKIVKKEDILAISIGDIGWDKSEHLFFSKDKVDDALKILDFEFDSGYGGEEGYNIFVWTKDVIIVKGCYDGSEWYECIPRNPTKKIKPFSIGGG